MCIPPQISGQCYLVIDYEGETYVGAMTFESHAFCKIFVDQLILHLKRSIKEIADLEISDIF